MIKLAISGAEGRMGRTIYKTLIGSQDFEIVYGVDTFPADDLPYPVYRSFEDSALSVDIILDFSSPASLDSILNFAVKNSVKCVLATTGYTEEQVKRVSYAAKQTAIFRTANMSLGINLLSNLSKDAMKFLGEAYDVEIVEIHHNQKLDAPSGTALLLANAINEVRDGDLVPTFGRHETAKRREKNEIGIHALRGGSVVGKHEVMFLGAGEQITLSHEAESKEVFVRGALRAAAFIMDKKTGLYDMNSILGDFYAVTSVASEKEVSLLSFPSITSTAFLALLKGIKDNNINLDMISQNINTDGTLAVSFSLPDKDLTRADKLIPANVGHTATVNTAKLTAEGAGMEHKSGVALEVLSILNGVGSTVYAITTSETKISCCINLELLAAAEAALKKYYKI